MRECTDRAEQCNRQLLNKMKNGLVQLTAGEDNLSLLMKARARFHSPCNRPRCAAAGLKSPGRRRTCRHVKVHKRDSAWASACRITLSAPSAAAESSLMERGPRRQLDEEENWAGRLKKMKLFCRECRVHSKYARTANACRRCCWRSHPVALHDKPGKLKPVYSTVCPRLPAAKLTVAELNEQ